MSGIGGFELNRDRGVKSFGIMRWKIISCQEYHSVDTRIKYRLGIKQVANTAIRVRNTASKLCPSTISIISLECYLDAFCR